MSVIYLIIFFVFYPKVDIYYCLTEEFNNFNILLKLIYVNLSIFLIKFRYYFCWTLSDAGVTASGLSYGGKNNQGEDSWDRIISVHPLNVETSLSAQDKMNNWNMSIQYWLKNYVYLRLYTF